MMITPSFHQDLDLPEVKLDKCLENCRDPVLTSVMNKHHAWITKEPAYLETDCNHTEKRLTKSEKQLAKRGYEMEKRMTNQRQNFATVYTRGPNGYVVLELSECLCITYILNCYIYINRI